MRELWSTRRMIVWTALGAAAFVGCASTGSAIVRSPEPASRVDTSAPAFVAAGLLEADVAAFAALDPLVSDLRGPIRDGEPDRATAFLTRRAGGTDLGVWIESSGRDRVRLVRMVAIADATRWTARALYRERHRDSSDRLAEDEATAAIASAYLREHARTDPGASWYLVRLVGFLESIGTEQELVHHLSDPGTPPLRMAVAHYLHGSGHPMPKVAAVLSPSSP